MFGLTVGDEWYPAIGDPSFMGWLTVAAYFVTAILCWKAAIKARTSNPGSGSRKAANLWLLLFALLLCLGINKQLDLQTWFTVLGKKIAIEQGWYERRRVVQAFFVLMLSAGGLLLALLVWRSARGSLRQHAWALFGGIFLLAFVVIRASSFHHVDQMLGFRLAGLKMNWLLELSGIGCIAIAAARELRHNSRTHEAQGGGKHSPDVELRN